MKFVTWNVNGLRACLDDGLIDYLRGADADIVSLQETRVGESAKELVLNGYSAAWNCAERTGYSGTACLFRRMPVSVVTGLGTKELDNEGRIITLEYKTFYFINAYIPNTQGYLDRRYYRLNLDRVFRGYVSRLIAVKPVVVCGDFNVTRGYIDTYPENIRNKKNPTGYEDEDRGAFEELLDVGLADVFRELHPGLERQYTWWSNKGGKRNDGKGRRLDYFLASRSLLSSVKSCAIRPDIYGSDHAPVEMEINI